MAIYGAQTWDEQGVSNNKGITPFNAQMQIALSANQTGSWTIQNPYGAPVGFIFIPTGSKELNTNEVNRSITVSGNTVTVSSTGEAYGNYSSRAGTLFITLLGGG
ncbi:hypothetical protein [Citrobacter sp. CK206]|uniref:hypothetical protein n=1 Tax=Citrobacter sp. CK206 TaxID=2985115 RepID=UPI001B9AF59F|nr:hypothetical protein [Citrobacter sp. CK206]MDM2956195.1 hypothetical protein [Citrobacter sp. CK206]HBC8645208.1 hypothetical protein [Citrobacter koseri]HCB2271268.1 hypothetical protein [Citrobacter koseri]